MRTGAKLHVFPALIHPVRHRHKGGIPEIVGDVEHPKFAPGFSKLGLQIAD